MRHLLESIRSDGNTEEQKEKPTRPRIELVHKLKDLDIATNVEILFEACRNGNVDIARKLLESSPQYMNSYDTYCYRFTLLHWACQSGSVELCQLILKYRTKEFDINAKETKFGSTALHMAYYTGKVDIYKALLEAGADVSLRNKFGETSLHLAAKAGYAECCQVLLNYNASVSETQKLGNTPLHWAALYKLNCKEEGSESRLHPVCEVLIKAGADVNCKNRDGAMPIHVACKKGNLAACLSLVAAEANVNAKDKSYAPLHYAAFNGHLRICEALLEAGANAAVLEEKLGSPLHFAAYKGNTKVCKLLLEHSSSLLEVKNRMDKTALELAREAGNSEVLEALTTFKHSKKQRNGSLVGTPVS